MKISTKYTTNNFNLFVSDFNKVKALGYVHTHRKSSTGIGKTYEDLLGVAENNLKEPDLHGFEIKSQRAYTGSYVTLFTKSPDAPKAVNTFLRESYGSQDSKYPELKVLHTSMFATKFNTHKAGFRFKLEDDKPNRQLQLKVMDKSNGISTACYWSYSVLNQCLQGKLKHLAYVMGKTRTVNETEEYHFDKAVLYSKMKPLSNFLDMVNQGDIMFDIRIGAYKTGKNKGKTHDHGSGFRIKKANMYKLYNYHTVI